MKEIYKDIKNYEGLYKISNMGNVLSLKTNKLLKINKITNGYCAVQLCKNGKRKLFLVHRLVAEHFISNPNNYNEVNHKDENKHNNTAKNLEWCTRKYNMNYKNLPKRQKLLKEYNDLLRNVNLHNNLQ